MVGVYVSVTVGVYDTDSVIVGVYVSVTVGVYDTDSVIVGVYDSVTVGVYDSVIVGVYVIDGVGVGSVTVGVGSGIKNTLDGISAMNVCTSCSTYICILLMS